MTIVSKRPWEESVRKLSLLPIEICSSSYIVLNWYLLGVEVNLGHAHKTRFWYLLGVFSKFSAEQPRHFYGQYPPGIFPPYEQRLLLSFSFVSRRKEANDRTALLMAGWDLSILWGGGGILLGILGRGLAPGSPNPNPILDQKMSFSTWHPFSDHTFKIHTRFQTWPLRRNYVINT